MNPHRAHLARQFGVGQGKWEVEVPANSLGRHVPDD